MPRTNPFGRNKPLAGGNSKRNGHPRVHRDTTQSRPENMRPPVPDIVKQQAAHNSRLEQVKKFAMNFLQTAYELHIASQIPSTDYILFHDWLHPNGKDLDIDRAQHLAERAKQYYDQPMYETERYYHEDCHKKEVTINLLKSCKDDLFSFYEDKHEKRRKKELQERMKYAELLEAYYHGKQQGFEEILYRYIEESGNDPNNNPLG